MSAHDIPTIVGGLASTWRSDAPREAIDQEIFAMLRRLRATLEMDVAFVSSFVDGRRLVRFVDVDPEDEYGQIQGADDPLEEGYCGLVVSGALPELIVDPADHPAAFNLAGTAACRVKSHISTPVVAEDGRVFGTVCCFSHAVKDEIQLQEDLETLRSIAAIVAVLIGSRPDTSRTRRSAGQPPPPLSS